MSTDALVAWLRQQLDEDERIAKQMTAGCIESGFYLDAESAATDLMAAAAHVYRWSPARVLREVEAKRRILDLAISAARHEAQSATDPITRLEKSLAKVTAPELERVVRLLALPFADRPGYRAEEWKP